MYIEQVPTPLILPFAILPFSEKRMAGILIPSFGEETRCGDFSWIVWGIICQLVSILMWKPTLIIIPREVGTSDQKVTYRKNYRAMVLSVEK